MLIFLYLEMVYVVYIPR